MAFGKDGFNGAVTDPEGLTTTFGAADMRVSATLGIDGPEMNNDQTMSMSSPTVSAFDM
ncbi:MAG: hypothetical protein ACRBB3_04830 [Alphaproteobacteria bacterium]